MFDFISPRLPVSTMPQEAPSGFNIRVATSDGKIADFTIASASVGGNELFWFLGSPVPDIVCSLSDPFAPFCSLFLLLQLLASFAELENVLNCANLLRVEFSCINFVGFVDWMVSSPPASRLVRVSLMNLRSLLWNSYWSAECRYDIVSSLKSFKSIVFLKTSMCSCSWSWSLFWANSASSNLLCHVATWLLLNYCFPCQLLRSWMLLIFWNPNVWLSTRSTSSLDGDNEVYWSPFRYGRSAAEFLTAFNASSRFISLTFGVYFELIAFFDIEYFPFPLL